MLSVWLLVPISLVSQPILSIRAYDFSGTKGFVRLSLSPDDRQVLTFAGADHWVSLPLWKLPPDAKRMELEADIRSQEPLGSIKEKLFLNIVDLGVMVGPLRDGARPFGERFGLFQEGMRKFEATYPKVADEGGLTIEPGAPSTLAEITAAEKRLGYSLPKEYVSLLTTAGPVSIEDSYFESPTSLNNAYQMMIDAWGTPKPDLDASLDDKTKALLQRSTLLFSEAGDGYGGLLFVLTQETGAPAYYWIHQDSINEPTPMNTADGQPRDFAGAFRWIVATLAFYRLEDIFHPVVFVDRSYSGTLPMSLQDIGGDYTIVPVWSEFP